MSFNGLQHERIKEMTEISKIKSYTKEVDD